MNFTGRRRRRSERNRARAQALQAIASAEHVISDVLDEPFEAETVTESHDQRNARTERDRLDAEAWRAEQARIFERKLATA